MTNERLRGAMVHTGVSAAALADAAQIDPKTVGRWLVEDRVPHPVTRQKVAAVLQQQETFLWPTLLVESDAASEIAVGEIDQVWPTRSMISARPGMPCSAARLDGSTSWCTQVRF